jgi:hypothetical protein
LPERQNLPDRFFAEKYRHSAAGRLFPVIYMAFSVTFSPPADIPDERTAAKWAGKGGRTMEFILEFLFEGIFELIAFLFNRAGDAAAVRREQLQERERFYAAARLPDQADEQKKDPQ